ncbi:MFS transporter [Streptomyces sp. SP17BM10]|uniref:MFS transporter n=1 Tax=Streptomyces sp. SP17BM10 TaxID=3002530 RepID=UPI002E7A7491|nr:MFS transporter [Streptomyces sp. SP17BM10]MEE1782454.1 MFS transporter [Streptomyces sp. SP17BM10]
MVGVGSGLGLVVPAARPVSVWRQRNFQVLWSAHTVSEFGTRITFFVIPVLALTTLSASTGQLGLVSAMETLPFLLVGLPAGALLDRWDRRRVMVVADVGRAAAIVALPVGYLAGVLSVPLLCAVGFAIGLCTVFFDIADQAFLPTVVTREQTPDGNSRLEFSRSTAELAGPSIGGLLLQVVTAPLVLVVNAVSYLVSALLLCLIRTPRTQAPPPGAGARPTMRSQIAEGLRFVFRHRTLRSLALATGISNLVGLGGALGAVLTAYALRDLGLSPGQLGLALSVGNCGALLGAALSSRLIRLVGLGPVLIAAKSMSGIAVLVLATAAPARAVPTLGAATGIMACGITVYNISQVSLRQAITPTGLQGRMNASVRFAIWGTRPVGALAGGYLGSVLGTRPTLWTIAGIGLLSCLPLITTEDVRTLRVFPSLSVD